MYSSTCFSVFQCAFPRLCAKQAKRLTGQDRSGHVMTCIHINNPKALQQGTFLISSISDVLARQSSVDRDNPYGSGIVSGEHECMLNLLRSHSVYALCDITTSPFLLRLIFMPKTNFTSPISLISQLDLSCSLAKVSLSRVEDAPSTLLVHVNVNVSSFLVILDQI